MGEPGPNPEEERILLAELASFRHQQETRNETALAYLRGVIFLLLLLGHATTLGVDDPPFRASHLSIALLVGANLANLALLLYLRRKPRYLPARKYLIASGELWLLTALLATSQFPAGELPTTISLHNYLTAILLSGLRLSTRLVLAVGAQCLFLELAVFVTAGPWVSTAVPHSVRLLVTTAVVAYLVHNLNALARRALLTRRQSELKNLFLGHVSHELRQPLTGILGFSALLQDGLRGELNPRQKEAVASISSHAEGLVSLVNELLDVARIEAGQLRLEVESVDLCQCLARASETVEPGLRERGVALTVEAPEECPVRGDFQRLYQVFVNLLSNAARFTERGSVGYRITCGEGSAWVRVSDTGPGIQPEDLPRIFDEFWRGQRGNTGLGLAIAQRLVRLHQGDIRVASRPGEGTEVTVRLPLAE
ncbi:MAG: HAMP domain-containing sensor histidine kinase [Candidatus Eremiobacterota bacterium]